MKKMLHMLLALCLAFLMVFGDAAAVLAEPGSAAAAVEESQLLARSRRKKNNAAATPAARPEQTETPAPGQRTEPTARPTPEGPIIEPQAIADYLFTYGELPENFITKKEAQALGWDSRFNYLSDVAPGKSIGGDNFGNYEGKLPTGKGIRYHEADCYYTGGRRNAHRVVYSTDGRVWYTGDHYNTFTELFPSEQP